MLFTSTSFAMFLPVAVAGFWFLPFAFRKWWLLGMSYIFYMGVFPKYVSLLFSVTVLNYLSGRAMELWPRRRRLFLWTAVTLNLGILAYFKYTDFLLQSVMTAIRMAGGSATFDSLAVLLPIGISFYILIGLSYSIDCFRRGFAPIKDFPLFACYLSFFPQLLSGPIVRAHQLLPQLMVHTPFRRDLFEQGIRLLLRGLFKKILLADRLAPVVSRGFSDFQTLSGPDAWVAAVGFTFQIYFDFSGYTDIARGAAKLFGYELPENFRLPYLARNPRDFWRRWHITLSTWLRDYLYVPLGGNRCSKARMYANLLITMALGGLWHGAAWSFVLWGIYHGLLLILHRQILYLSEALPYLKRALESLWGKILSVATTFVLVALGLVMFRSPTVGDAVGMYQAMMRLGPCGPVTDLLLRSAVLFFALGLVFYHGARLSLKRYPKFFSCVRRTWTYGALTCLVLLVLYWAHFHSGGAEAPEPFIYFQF